MSSKEPEIELDLDSQMNGILIITCPECKKKMKKKFKQIAPGNEASCQCGFTIKFSGDDLRRTQRSLDDLKRALKNFGK